MTAADRPEHRRSGRSVTTGVGLLPVASAPPAGDATPTRPWTGLRPPWRRQGSQQGPWPPMSPRQRTRRRRLLLGSLPVVVLLVLGALRLLTLNPVASQTLAAYEAGDRAGTETWGERQGWVNIVEPFRSPFAIGDSHVLTGSFAQARPWFEQALNTAPKGGIDECKVRVNLGLTYEALGDAAKAKERTAEWKQFYEKGIQTTSQRPPLCEAPEGKQTGEALRQAQQRMEQKNADPQDPPGQAPPQQPGDTPDPQPTPQPQPTPDPQNTPSQERQDLLREQRRQNTIERNEQLEQHGRDGSGAEGPAYPKPW